MQRTMEVKVQVETPRGWILLGALLGAGVGAILSSIALGVFAALLLPVSQRERQLIEPAKRKAQEGISHLGDQLEQKLQGPDVGTQGSSMAGSDSMERAEVLMGADRPGIEGSDRAESLASPTGSRIPPMPPLDDLTTKLH